MKIVPLLIVSVCLILGRSSTARAQTNAPAPLPPAAQEAMEKGLIAAKQREYLLAIQLFQDARKTAPHAPVLLFNLGLAESRIPGRELRAMTWFGAYLEASPDAANAADVKDKIRMLDAKNLRSLIALVRVAEDAAKQLGETQYDRSISLGRVAVLWAEIGDSKMAIQTTDSIPFTDLKSRVLVDVATAQAESGDIAGAQRTAASIQELKDAALRNIAQAQAKAGDIAGAQRTAGGIQYAIWKDEALAVIAVAQVRAGDLTSAQRTANSIRDKGSLIKIAEAQEEAGDIPGARRTADSIQDAYAKGEVLAAIAVAQVRAGDIAGAKRTAGGIQDAIWKSYAVSTIATLRKTIIASNVVAQRHPGTSRWIEMTDGPLNAAAFLDIGTHLKSLPSDDAKAIFKGLNDAAAKIVDARQAITGMLKAQAESRATQ